MMYGILKYYNKFNFEQTLTRTGLKGRTTQTFFSSPRPVVRSEGVVALQSLERTMADQQEKAFCVLQYAKTESVILVQRAFRRRFGKDSPTDKSIRKWYHQFEETGCLCKGKSTGRPRVSNENVEKIRATFVRSPRKSTNQASYELGLPQTSVWRVLRKRLQMKPYRLQMIQALFPRDKHQRMEFCRNVQDTCEHDTEFFSRLVFSDEATFHISGKVNRHNVRIWGTENPHCAVEHERDSAKLNVFCAMSEMKLYGPFFFVEQTVNGNTYLDMLQIWLFPQLQDDSNNFVFQLDGAPPHWKLEVREFLNNVIPNRWIGRAGTEDKALFPWPPRSPDITPCDFFLWGFVKDTVYVPPLPRNLDDLQTRISNALNLVTPDMLKRVWQELDYRLDIVRVTRGSHIEHL